MAAEQVGIPKLTRHMMRHTFATFLGGQGATDMDLMDLGGWKSVAMVRRYRKVVDERLDSVMDAFNKSQDTKTAEDQILRANRSTLSSVNSKTFLYPHKQLIRRQNIFPQHNYLIRLKIYSKLNKNVK